MFKAFSKFNFPCKLVLKKSRLSSLSLNTEMSGGMTGRDLQPPNPSKSVFFFLFFFQILFLTQPTNCVTARINLFRFQHLSSENLKMCSGCCCCCCCCCCFSTSLTSFWDLLKLVRGNSEKHLIDI